jgi:AraC-like DNA-binding protein
MKTLVQKINVEENYSFACRSYTTPYFETNWHKHEETEIIVITEGHGSAIIGDYISDYKAGDVFYIASNLPHWFRKSNTKVSSSAIVAHFNKDIFGKDFLQNPEIRAINKLLHKTEAYALDKKLKTEIGHQLKNINTAKGATRFLLLLDVINKISSSNLCRCITQDFNLGKKNINPAIEKIIDFSFKHYLEPVKLVDVAATVKMSIPTFCRFFKSNIKKTYFQFLQELRINQACKLLKTTNKPIMDICYESGYNSWAHFSKQFKQLKQKTPGAYRKEFTEIEYPLQ